ncbi:MAG TPA: NADH-quinone oxidoreductase subunit N [Myxococcota bacterium]
MIPAPELNLDAALPLLLIAGGAFLVLALDLFLGPRASEADRYRKNTVLSLASVGVLAAVIWSAALAFGAGSAREFSPEHPMFQLDRLAAFGSAVVCVGALLSTLLSAYYLKEIGVQHGEYYALTLIATSGMVLLVGSVDLVSAFLGIELMSIPIYVLAGFDRRKLRSNEAALKYFLAGSFASALLLYGMALLYGATGQTSYAGIAAGFDGSDPIGVIGLALVLVGFTFKISAVPFHQWTPDVYEGAPASVTAFMSVTVKAAAFIALLRLLDVTAGPLVATTSDALTAVLWWLCAATMVLGNLMAVIQDNVKRMLAYSSIAHAGYLLLGLVAGGAAGQQAVLFYLLAYVFLNLGAFAVVIALTHRGHDADSFEEYAGLAKRRPALAALMTLFMVGLAGIPGTAGFLAKLRVFMAAVESDASGRMVLLVVIGALMSVVSFFYYLRLPRLMYMSEPGEAAGRQRLSFGETTVLAVCAVAVIVLGLLPNNGPDDLLSFVRAFDWTRESIAALN